MMKRLAVSALVVAAMSGPAAAQELTDERIKELALEAILENPQIVMDAVDILRERDAAERAAAAAAALQSQRALLEGDENAYVLGNPDGDVTVVEFFDYNCGYCRRAKPVVEGLVAADDNVRVVLREFPILSEGSEFAARAALAAKEQGLYEELHWALMSLSGPANEAVVMSVAGDVGLDLDQLRLDMEADKVAAHIHTSKALAQSMGINATPVFIVGDTILPGLVDQARLEEIIDQVRSEG